MIQFKLTNCPDRSQVGNYDHHDNNMTIGSQGADMVIDDPELQPIQVKVFYQNGEPFVENVAGGVDVKVNATAVAKGKSQKIKPRDTIRMGKTSIFLTALADTAAEPPAPFTDHEELLIEPDTVINAIWESLKILSENNDPFSGSRMEQKGKFVAPPPVSGAAPPPPIPASLAEKMKK